MNKFKVGDEVCIVDASEGNWAGSFGNGESHFIYNRYLNQPASVIRNGPARNTLAIRTSDGKEVGVYPWRLTPITVSLENE
jgi:hypothetical protein